MTEPAHQMQNFGEAWHVIEKDALSAPKGFCLEAMMKDRRADVTWMVRNETSSEMMGMVWTKLSDECADHCEQILRERDWSDHMWSRVKEEDSMPHVFGSKEKGDCMYMIEFNREGVTKINLKTHVRRTVRRVVHTLGCGEAIYAKAPDRPVRESRSPWTGRQNGASRWMRQLQRPAAQTGPQDLRPRRREH